MGRIGDVDDIGLCDGICAIGCQLRVAGENDEVAVRTDHRVIARAGGTRSAEDNFAGGKIVKKDFRRMRSRRAEQLGRIALNNEVVSVSANRSGARARASCCACDRCDGAGR